MAAAPGLMKVTLKLKRPADEEAHDERRCKPRVAPPSEDLEAAKALSGLFGAAPSPAPAPSKPTGQTAKVLQLAKGHPKNYKLSERQLDGILQLAQAGSSQPPAPAAPAPARPASKITFEQLRTTLWDTVAKKRIPATAYNGDMASFLARNPHLEVYNRQDRVRSTGQTLMAGMRIPTFPAPENGGSSGSGEHLKVVVWHTLEHRKLTREEAPTQGNLCRFLQMNPHIVVYEGQVAPIISPRVEPEPPLKKPTLPIRPVAPAAAAAAPPHAKPLQPTQPPGMPKPAAPKPAAPPPIAESRVAGGLMQLAAAPKPVAPKPAALPARPPPVAEPRAAGELMQLAAYAQQAAAAPSPRSAPSSKPGASKPAKPVGGVRWKGMVALQAK